MSSLMDREELIDAFAIAILASGAIKLSQSATSTHERGKNLRRHSRRIATGYLEAADAEAGEELKDKPKAAIDKTKYVEVETSAKTKRIE